MLLLTHQGIVAIDREGVAEVARWSDLRQGPVVHVHELEVWLQRWSDLIVREGAGDVALVRPLEVIQGREVVDVLRARSDGSWPKGRDGRGAGPRSEDQSVAGIGGGRATALRISGAGVLDHAGAIVPSRLQHRLHLAIAEVSDRMAAVIVERRTQRHCAVERPAIGHAAAR